MTAKIYIITSDNVFFLLVSSFIKERNKNIECIKVIQYEQIENSKKVSIIIVDGKMTIISPIAVIYNLRYKMQITSSIWLFSDIIFSGYIDKAIEVGASKVIYKPFDPIEISEKVERFVLNN